jgi:hypothetical protein
LHRLSGESDKVDEMRMHRLWWVAAGRFHLSSATVLWITDPPIFWIISHAADWWSPEHWLQMWQTIIILRAHRGRRVPHGEPDSGRLTIQVFRVYVMQADKGVIKWEVWIRTHNQYLTTFRLTQLQYLKRKAVWCNVWTRGWSTTTVSGWLNGISSFLYLF